MSIRVYPGEDFPDGDPTILPGQQSNRNFLVDGGNMVAQGGTPAIVAAVLQYGTVDAWKIGVFTAVPTVCVMQQNATSALGRTGFSLRTIVSAPAICTLRSRTFIEATSAKGLKNAIASFSCIVQHTVTATLNYQITISKATAADNFAALTQIAQSALLPVVGPTVATPISLLNVAMGDCSFGICIDVEVTTTAAVVTRTFELAEACLNEGLIAAPFPYEPFADVYMRATRLFQKSFAYTVSPVQAVGSVLGALSYRVVLAGVNPESVYLRFVTKMRVAPTMTYFNPAAANALWRNATLAADSGAAASSASLSESGVAVSNAQVVGDLLGNTIDIHWTADCRF